ncbi:putative signal peptide protein [Puccinia sorghi]|uniref:Putative signal peptide protein n=1 Tax=Puccinia sorghi TaxID=27349 RepID=A0A0L6VIQ8_9BASI|nr:putative signal peptide protein [Puccinia sorghi]
MLFCFPPFLVFLLCHPSSEVINLKHSPHSQCFRSSYVSVHTQKKDKITTLHDGLISALAVMGKKHNLASTVSSIHKKKPMITRRIRHFSIWSTHTKPLLTFLCQKNQFKPCAKLTRRGIKYDHIYHYLIDRFSKIHPFQNVLWRPDLSFLNSKFMGTGNSNQKIQQKSCYPNLCALIEDSFLVCNNDYDIPDCSHVVLTISIITPPLLLYHSCSCYCPVSCPVLFLSPVPLFPVPVTCPRWTLQGGSLVSEQFPSSTKLARKPVPPAPLSLTSSPTKILTDLHFLGPPTHHSGPVFSPGCWLSSLVTGILLVVGFLSWSLVAAPGLGYLSWSSAVAPGFWSSLLFIGSCSLIGGHQWCLLGVRSVRSIGFINKRLYFKLLHNSGLPSNWSNFNLSSLNYDIPGHSHVVLTISIITPPYLSTIPAPFPVLYPIISLSHGGGSHPQLLWGIGVLAPKTTPQRGGWVADPIILLGGLCTKLQFVTKGCGTHTHPKTPGGCALKLGFHPHPKVLETQIPSYQLQPHHQHYQQPQYSKFSLRFMSYLLFIILFV